MQLHYNIGHGIEVIRPCPNVNVPVAHENALLSAV